MARINVCSIAGCAKETRCYRTLCDMHISRLKRNGSTDTPPPKRVVTDAEAWCNKGQHMVEHHGFAKGQTMCRECRKVYNVNNFSKGLVCLGCGKQVANTSRTLRCRPCHSAWAKAEGVYSRPRRWVNAYGYVLLNQHYGHPNANHKGEIIEHVLVMAEILGRPLVKGENVHHKNGVRNDNRPENLELWVVSQPAGQRPEDLVQWAREILARYEIGARDDA